MQTADACGGYRLENWYCSQVPQLKTTNHLLLSRFQDTQILLHLLTGHFEWTSTGANHSCTERTITFSSLLVQPCVFTRVQTEIWSRSSSAPCCPRCAFGSAHSHRGGSAQTDCQCTGWWSWSWCGIEKHESSWKQYFPIMTVTW